MAELKEEKEKEKEKERIKREKEREKLLEKQKKEQEKFVRDSIKEVEREKERQIKLAQKLEEERIKKRNEFVEDSIKQAAKKIEEERIQKEKANYKAKKIAVFDPTGVNNQSYTNYVRGEIQKIFVNQKNKYDLPIYAVLEREQIDVVLKENKYQSSGLVDEGEVRELGKQLGAELVCVSTIGKIDGDYYVSIRIINVETAVTISAGSGEGSKLKDATQDALNDLLGIEEGGFLKNIIPL